MRNFDRINNEIKKYDYNPIQYSFYYIDKVFSNSVKF